MKSSFRIVEVKDTVSFEHLIFSLKTILYWVVFLTIFFFELQFTPHCTQLRDRVVRNLHSSTQTHFRFASERSDRRSIRHDTKETGSLESATVFLQCGTWSRVGNAIFVWTTFFRQPWVVLERQKSFIFYILCTLLNKHWKKWMMWWRVVFSEKFTHLDGMHFHL